MDIDYLFLSTKGVRKKRQAFDRIIIGELGLSTDKKKQEIPSGTILGNYRLIELIGIGGFGQVYRAESIEVYREVAVKLYKIDDIGALNAFRRGANYLAQIDHPNIIKMLDFFTMDSYAVMVMELLSPEQTLRQVVGEFCNQENIDWFVKIFGDILSAIRYCHQKKYRDIDGSQRVGIYHGDIKPDNIFLQRGQVKIADFMIPNLAQFIQKRKEYESFPMCASDLYGTPMYMSPEQFGGIVNEQTDIYNIGITMFELLTGFYPYDSQFDYRRDTCKSPMSYCPHSPHWLNRILVKCVMNNKDRRYFHISEIEGDIMKKRTNLTQQQNEILDVLVVFANPKGSDPLRLSNEDRVIHECLRLSQYRDNIHLNILHAATIHDVRRALLESDYKVIHFSGHSTGTGLAFENEIGQIHIIPPDALSGFISDYSPPIECVILNACYTKSQGQLLVLDVPYTIATEGPISDSGATEFTRGFYDAIGAGKDIEFAYREGCRTLRLTGHQESEKPILISK